jgi:hypothetical protein
LLLVVGFEVLHEQPDTGNDGNERYEGWEKFEDEHGRYSLVVIGRLGQAVASEVWLDHLSVHGCP